MDVRAATLPMVLLLAACTTAWPMTIESARFPSVQIECTGSRELPPDQCLAWAERMLDGPAPSMIGEELVGQLRLTSRGGNSRCAADFYDSTGGLLLTVSAVCP